MKKLNKSYPVEVVKEDGRHVYLAEGILTLIIKIIQLVLDSEVLWFIIENGDDK